MKVDCLIRPLKFGEVHSCFYDTETGLIDGIPDNMFNLLLNPSKWSKANYVNGHNYPIGLMEKYMHLYPNCQMCIEIDNIGFYALTGESIYLITRDFGNTIHCMCYEQPLFKGEFKAIGYVKTKARQFSVNHPIYRMTYDAKSQMVLIDGKLVKPNFGVFMCGDIPQSAEGYSKCILEDYAGVIYNDGNPLFVKLEDGLLKLV